MKGGKRAARERRRNRYASPAGLWDLGWAPDYVRRQWDADFDYPRLPPPEPVRRIDLNWVTDRVATGGGVWSEADVAYLREQGITHVVTAAVELHATSARLLDGVPGISVLLNGLPDDGKWKPVWWFAKTLDFTREALTDPGAKVYLHCWSGKNRGPCHAYAVLRDLGHTPVEAERLIRRARPKVILLYQQDADEAIGRITA